MRAPLVHVPALALFAGLVAGQSQTAKTVDIYLIDVEGGNAQLYRLPSGESVLIDSGNGGAAAGPGAPRIKAAPKGGGLTQNDYLDTTHLHRGQLRGAPQIPTSPLIRRVTENGAQAH